LRTEGLVVDPVYTAKALAELRRATDEPVVVFWHTGGLSGALAPVPGTAGTGAGGAVAVTQGHQRGPGTAGTGAGGAVAVTQGHPPGSGIAWAGVLPP
jgi:hypothetical protein